MGLGIRSNAAFLTLVRGDVSRYREAKMPVFYPRARSCVALVSLVALAANAQAQTAARSDTLPPVVVKKDEADKQKKKAATPKKKKEAPAIAQGPAEPAEAVPGEPSTDVIYSANRVPTDITKVGSAVSVITRDQIEAQSRTYVQDYLAQVPGVSVAQTGLGGTSSYSIWGAASKYVRVQVDGLDLSDPTGTQVSTALEHILAGDVSRIEVLKGSQSLLYGGQAIGGVIAIETARPVLGASLSASGEAGSYNTQRGTASAAYGTDRGYARFTVQSVRTDGYSAAALGTEDDSYRNLTFSGTGEYAIAENVKVFFSARSLDSNLRYDDGYDFFTGLLEDGDLQARVLTNQRAGRVGTEVKLFDGAFVNTFAIQGMELDRTYLGYSAWSMGPYTSYYSGDRWKAEYLGVGRITNWATVTAGADYQEETAQTTYFAGRESDLTGVFGQLAIEPLTGLTITGGARNDEHSQFGDYQTYRLTGAYFYEPTQTKFRGSTGTGFRAPSLYELYAPGTYGNSDLKPETSESWDAGIDQWIYNRRIRVSLTYFDLDTTDEIRLINSHFTQMSGTNNRSGVELSATAQVTPFLGVTGGYTYTDARTADGTRLSLVPRNMVSLGADVSITEKLRANVTAQVVLDTMDALYPPALGYATVPVKGDDYLLLSAKFSYDIRPGLSAYVRGENLLDQDYQAARGYGTPGLSVFGGLTFNVDANTYASLK